MVRTRSQVLRMGARLLGLASVAPLAGVLAGCGQSAAQQAAPQRGPVAIDVLTYPGVANPTGRGQWFDRATRERFTPQTEISVNWIEGDGGLPQKVIALTAAGTPPDAGSYVGTDAPALAAKGLYRPLDDLIRRDKFDRNAYWKSALQMMSLDGKLYGLPNHGSFGENVMYVNLEMTKRAGITVPLATGEWTTDQMIEWSQRLTRRSEGEWGWWPSVALFGTMISLRLFGADLLSPDGKRCIVDSPAARQALQWIHDTQHKFQIVENLLGAGGGRGVNGFRSGKQAFANWTTGGAAEYKAPGQTLIRFEMGITLFPKHPSGRRASHLIAHGTGVTNTTKTDAAWRWVQFITNKENGVLQVLGGAGSPGTRPDVWEDPRLLQSDPIFALSQKVLKDPMPDYLPWNYTYAEVSSVVSARLNELWENKASVNDTVAAIGREVNALLQRPPS